MNKISLSTGHKELDDILAKNGIIDQETQEKEQLDNFMKKFQIDLKKESTRRCLHDTFNESLVRIGRAKTIQHARMMPRMISCSCSKCSPFYL